MRAYRASVDSPEQAAFHAEYSWPIWALLSRVGHSAMKEMSPLKFQVVPLPTVMSTNAPTWSPMIPVGVTVLDTPLTRPDAPSCETSTVPVAAL